MFFVLFLVSVFSHAADFCSDPVGVICSGKPGRSKSIPDTKDVIENLKKAVEQSPFASEDKKSFLGFLIRTKIYKASEYTLILRKDRPLPTVAASRLDLIERVCGEDFKKPMAISFHVDEERKQANEPVIVICDSLENESHRAMALAHELSHIYSARWKAGLYKSFAECLKESNSNIIDEMASDYWAKQTLKLSWKNLSSTDLLASIKASYHFFCDLKGSRSHPSGRSRIEWIAKDPDLRKQMGCNEVLPYCSP